MLLVLFAVVVFAFLLLGSTAFAVCVLLPPTRRYALSVAFWFALCGPCLVMLITIAGLGLVAGALVMRAGNVQFTNARDSRMGISGIWILNYGYDCNLRLMAAPKDNPSFYILSLPALRNTRLCGNRKCIRLVLRLVPGRIGSAYTPPIRVVGVCNDRADRNIRAWRLQGCA